MRSIFPCLILLFVTACVAKKTSTVNPEFRNLYDKEWKLTMMNGSSELAELFPERMPELKFMNDGRITGNDGCNSISAKNDSTGLSSGKIDLQQMASTRRACQFNGPTFLQEALRNCRTMKISSNSKLELFDQNQSKLLEFE